MALIDEAQIHVRSGSGGNGCISFRREKFVPFGGPNGGDGGRGGDVILKATRDKASLLDFKFQPKYEARRGEHGMGSDCNGRGGDDLLILLPVGTLIFDAETDELLYDLKEDGDTIQIAKGGKGGLGNLTFKSSTNRAPRKSTPGQPGIEKDLRLELRLLADIGLVGLPNAGKSSFLSRVSRARPKVADYPFTTLEPNLGVMEHKDTAIVIADLPGLIEGASDGAGLGHRFLKHVSRNRVLLHLVELNDDVEVMKNSIETIREEIGAFDASLLEREQVLVFTKADLFLPEDLDHLKTELEKADLKGYVISSKTGQGLEPLLDDLTVRAQNWRQEAVEEAVAEAAQETLQ